MTHTFRFLFVGFFFGFLALAAPQNQDEETGSQLKDLQMLESSGALSNGKWLGVLDFRPTASLKGQDSFRFENSAELGYQFSPSFSVAYHQDFWTNLYNSSLVGGSEGLGLKAQDGFFDWYRDRVLESSDKTLSLSYEGRLILPVMSSRREAGLLSALRTYFIIGKKFSEFVTVNLIEAPIIHAYSQSSHNGKANPLFENRVSLQVALNLSKNLGFSLPLSWSATKMRKAPGASSSDAMDHFVWINPELTYSVDSNYSVGMGYYDTTSLIRSDFTAFQIGEGLEDGVVQVFLRASL